MASLRGSARAAISRRISQVVALGARVPLEPREPLRQCRAGGVVGTGPHVDHPVCADEVAHAWLALRYCPAMMPSAPATANGADAQIASPDAEGDQAPRRPASPRHDTIFVSSIIDTPSRIEQIRRRILSTGAWVDADGAATGDARYLALETPLARCPNLSA